MALVLKDRVKETSTTTGTGTFTLAGAVSGFQSFSVIGNANTVYYAIVNLSASEWEVGLGTYTSSGTLLSRDTVLESSNSGSEVNFSAGTKDVFCTYPAEKAVTLDDVQTLSNKTIASPSVSGNLTFTGTGNRITGDFSNATIANRVMFQSSTANGQTAIGLIPNGTSTQSQFIAFNGTDPANSSYLQALVSNTETRINSGQLGTGTALPMTFFTSSLERARIDTSGNVGIGTSSPTAKLHINSSSSPQIKFGGSDPAYYWALDRESLVGGNLQFSNANGGASTVRMTLDSSGNVLVGTTTAQGKLTVNGAVCPTGAVGSYSIDTSSVSTVYANGATQDFASMSGVIIANSAVTGRCTIYATGGGGVGVIGSSVGQCGTMAYNAGVAGYRWTNNYGSSDTVTFMVFRTRQTA